MRWRFYDPRNAEDTEQVCLLHLEQEKRIGRTMDLPDLAEWPVVLPAVLENGTGRLRGAIYTEAVAEVCFIGTEAVLTANASQIAPQVLASLRGRGFRICRMLIPKSLPDSEREIIRAELKSIGFVPTTDLYEHFMFDLRAMVAP